MAKEISFSEFLKEGVLKPETAPPVSEVIAEKPIRIEPDAPATDKEMKQYWKQVRHFFRTGQRPEGVNGMLIPALLAPYLKAGNYTNDYPVYISADGSVCKPLVNLIQEAFDTCFAADDAKILRANLPRILRDFKAEVVSEKHFALFSKAWASAETDLHSVDVHGDKQKLYIDHIETLKKALPTSGFVLRFSDEAPFIMLQLHLQERANNREEFFKKIKINIATLQEMLGADAGRKATKETSKTETGFDFAEGIISLDKVGAMLPTEGTHGLSETRKTRLLNVVETLKVGLPIWQKSTANVIVTEALFEAFKWNEILEGANIIKAGVNEGYKLTEDTFDASIDDFSKFIVAERSAALEVKDAYKEDIHDDFFGHFSWHRLTHEELLFYPPVIFVGETQGFLKNNLQRFSALLSLNKPIRLMAIEKRLVNAPNPNINWEDASHGYHQELAALAIAHRSAHTFQSAINQPVAVFKGIEKCLNVDAPSVMNLLIPEAGEVKITEILKLAAAVEGRFFPSITYDLSEGKKWGSRFDINENPHPEANWPAYDCKFVDIDGAEKTQKLAFTYADYKAVTREKSEELMLIPESFKSDDLLPLADYLESPIENLTGKVPYIWLVNEANCLKRAALPYMWVVSCQERLDNWNYVQELGGINSYHVTEALAREKAIWEANKTKEIAALKLANDALVENTKNTAANEAMERLTNVLLGLDAMPINGAAKPAPAKPAAQKAEEKPAAAAVKPAPAKKEEAVEMGAEAYLESFKCTTCNECTEKFPHVFEYNEDKQAFIKEGHKGKFSELVIAAEACPAHCIHPGQPTNKNEKDLDELIKRAAKFN